MEDMIYTFARRATTRLFAMRAFIIYDYFATLPRALFIDMSAFAMLYDRRA